MEKENQKDRKMRELQAQLQRVEADWEAGRTGYTLDELDGYLDGILEEK